MNNKWISEYINEISDTNEDTDLGHTDNEPDMLSSDLSVIARYAAELKDVMDTLSNTNDEIDLPHWWQAKVIKAKDYLIGAKHYLRAELEKNQSNTITSEDYKKKLEERVMELTEKNVPTDSSKWSYYKAQAKKKFDVYPSAYANGWAAKQYKAAGGGWKTENKESVDEAKSMDMNKRLKVYDKLKKGDEITIKYGSSMSSGREGKFKVTKGKTVVGKEKVERIILQNVANPKGVKYYLYQRNGNVTMAIGDMGATIEDMSESVNEGTKYKVGQKTPVGKIIGTSVWGKGRKQEWFYDVQNPGHSPKQYSEKSLDKIMGESVVNEAKAKSKDTKGIRLAEAIYNNVEAIMEAVEREKMDVDTVVGSFGPVLVNAIKATLKHKFKPTDGNEVKLKDFYSELKDLLKVAESLVNRPSKAGLNKLAAAHTIWWNHKSGAAVVLNGKHTDNIVESVNEAQKVNSTSKKFLKGMKRIKVKGLGGYMPGVDYVYVDGNKYYFVDFEGDHMELKNTNTIKQLHKLHGSSLGESVNEAKDNLYLQLHKKYAEQIKGLKAKKIKKLTDLVSVQRRSMEDRKDYFDMDSKKKKELSKEYDTERKLFKKYIGGNYSVMLPKGTETLAEESINEAKEPEVITQLRKIVKDKQNDLIKDTKSGKKVRVDMGSANLMVQVYDALKKQSNKDKFVKSGIVNMGHMAYKLMKKENTSEVIEEAEYQGRKVELNKPMQGDSKKFKVYVKNEKGNVVVVHFGQKGMVIKKDNPAARKSFRARMNCDNPGPKWKANYWSCRKW